MPTGRRGTLELYRDGLLVLALKGRPEKRTRVMYGLNVSWHAFKSFEEDAIRKNLLRRVRAEEIYERFKERPDGRTRYWLELTTKGQYALRWLDELLKYLADESGPDINPPLWILRTLFRGRFEQLGLPHPVLEGSHTVKTPTLEFTLRPIRTLFDADVSLPAKFIVLQPSQYAVVEEEEHEPIIVSWTEDLKAVLFVRHPIKETGFCPECGKPVSGLRGLKIHIGHKHPEKKKEILSAWRQFLDRQR
jgi:hypothetical protein